MNCAESHDLLLDLAYGELPQARAAEVESHVAGCAACRAEKDQLDEARRLVAPLREVEEPPPGFDERILRAARAEAGMQAEGTPGPVVEVSASVKPLGLQAARLDPHAEMRRDAGQARPRWGRRAAVVGSIAAAAGLAVVVTSSLTTRQAAIHEEVRPIEVRAPSAPVAGAVDEALRKEVASAPASDRAVPGRRAAPVAQAPEKKAATGGKADKQELAKASRARETEPPSQHIDVSFGDAMQSQGVSSGAAGAKVAEKAKGAEPRTDVAAAKEAQTKDAPAKDVQATEASQYANRSMRRAPSGPPAMSPAVGGAAVSAPRTADQLEEDASAARRRGEYARAGSLYRDASALRKASEPARAAWDLAHAVECLAAGGFIPEAVASRKELVAAFPDQSGPRAAADSALRSVPLPPDEEKPANSR